MSEKTHAEIIAEMRQMKRYAKSESNDCRYVAYCCYQTFADKLEYAHKREVDELKQRLAELNAEVAAKDEVIKRLNDAIAEEQRRKMATTENSSEVGNAAKLREAAVKIIDYLEPIRRWTMPTKEYGTEPTALFAAVDTVYEMATAALAAPARNCDVGTAEGQEKRFHDFCRARHLPRTEDSGYCAYKCPLIGDTCCELAWAQLPYGSEAAK